MRNITIDRRFAIKAMLTGIAVPLAGRADVSSEVMNKKSAQHPPAPPAMCAELHIADDFRMSDLTG
jgi:hypothetical protein